MQQLKYTTYKIIAASTAYMSKDIVVFRNVIKKATASLQLLIYKILMSLIYFAETNTAAAGWLIVSTEVSCLDSSRLASISSNFAR